MIKNFYKNMSNKFDTLDLKNYFCIISTKRGKGKYIHPYGSIYLYYYFARFFINNMLLIFFFAPLFTL